MIPVNFAGVIDDQDPTFLIHVKPMAIGRARSMVRGFRGLAILKIKAQLINGEWIYDPADVYATQTHFLNQDRAISGTLAAARSKACTTPAQPTNPTPSN